MPLYTYICPVGHETELLRGMDVRQVSCMCGLDADRRPFNRVYQSNIETFSLGPTSFTVGGSGLDVDTPQTRQKFSLFQEASQELAYNGHPSQGDSLWEQAKASAKQMIAAGEAPLPAKKG